MKEKDKITQFHTFFDLDKEIAYINRMNHEGWKLVYIKLGCFYTFIKSEPDEYVTILHADKKENVSAVTAFAAQCGYENIPHTTDGFGDMMYLTGRRAEVSDDFISDNESKLLVNTIFKKRFTVICLLYVIIALVLVVETFVIDTTCLWLWTQENDRDAFLLGMGIFLTTFTILSIGMMIRCFMIRHKYSKRIKALRTDANIYE